MFGNNGLASSPRPWAALSTVSSIDSVCCCVAGELLAVPGIYDPPGVDDPPEPDEDPKTPSLFRMTYPPITTAIGIM